MEITATAWLESQAIWAIRDGAELWETGSEDSCLIDISPTDQLVITTDQINARQAYPGEDVRSLVRRGVIEAISDVAAAGAEVLGIQIDVRAPDWFDQADFRAIGLGIRDVLTETGGQILQASNMSRGEFGLSTTVVGTVPRGTAIRRSGAAPGDALVLSGPVGGWDGALAVLNAGKADDLSLHEWQTVKTAFLDYQPELRLGQLLRRTGMVTACIDANDCLVKSCTDLADSSDVGLTIAIDQVPVAEAARIAAAYLGLDAIGLAIDGMVGDDQLLFTVNPLDVETVLSAAQSIAPRATVIGHATANSRQIDYVGTFKPRDGSGLRPTSIYTNQFLSKRVLGVSRFPRAGSIIGQMNATRSTYIGGEDFQ